MFPAFPPVRWRTFYPLCSRSLLKAVGLGTVWALTWMIFSISRSQTCSTVTGTGKVLDGVSSLPDTALMKKTMPDTGHKHISAHVLLF